MQANRFKFWKNTIQVEYAVGKLSITCIKEMYLDVLLVTSYIPHKYKKYRPEDRAATPRVV